MSDRYTLYLPLRNTLSSRGEQSKPTMTYVTSMQEQDHRWQVSPEEVVDREASEKTGYCARS